MLLRTLKAARPLAIAAGCLLIPALLQAQTLIVRGAPAGQAVELLVNETQLAAGVADEQGDAVIEWTLPADEMDARISVDICGATHRIRLMDRNLIPKPQEAGCERRDVVGVFWVRPVSTVVVMVDRPIPPVLLRQRDVTIAQLDAPPVPRRVPTGLVLFGGTGFGSFRDQVSVMCGTVTTCDGDQGGMALAGGAEIWLVRALSLEAALIRPPRPSAEGGGGTFLFESQFEPTLVGTLAVKAGVPIGPMRFYGKGGAVYQRSKMTTEQSMDDEAGEMVTLSMAFETRGWGWLAGAGLEGWITQSLGVYAEATTNAFKGKDPGGGEAFADDRMTTIFFGLRMRVLGGR
jgi:hypothetical protein